MQRLPRILGAWLPALVGAATLLAAPRPARALSDVCYRGGANLANFKLNGTAVLNGSSIVITQDTGNQGGSAMYQNKFSSSADFHIKMYVKISTTSSPQPADGMTFIMHNDSRGTTAVGGLGDGIGYSGIINSVAIEFDTYYNNYFADPTTPHIAITKQGIANHGDAANTGLPVVRFNTLSPVIDPTNGTPFYIWIDYLAGSHVLSIYVATANTKPGTAALTTSTLNLATELGATFYVGFTASTGGAWDKHEFLELYATDNLATANGSCCDTDSDCIGSSFGSICDVAKHLCGTCLPSSTSACGGTTTACSLAGAHNVCSVPCNGNFGSGASAACSSAAFPACRTTGVGAGSCSACNGDYQSGATSVCASSAPFCAANGYCGLCTVNSDCTAAGAAHTGGFCNSTTGKCVTACSVDADCGATLNACLSSLCIAKAANGAAIPGGTCNATNGSRFCVAGVCATSNNTCGYLNGAGSTCTAGNAATVCQSGACSTAGVCIPAASGSCYVDGECASGFYCERSSYTCKAKLAAGSAIPSDGLHNGTCTAGNASATCISSACNTTTNTCAGANNATCSAANQCVTNLCGSNGKCGAANGQSGCTAGTAATYCQSATCNAGGVCIPAVSGCYVDTDCGSGNFCRRDTFTCTAKLNAGVAIPNDGLHGGTCTTPVAAAVCATSLCNATSNTCAGALNATCAGAADCQIDVCGGNGKCGYANGAGACTGATAATLCQSATCSVGGVCISSTAGSCWVDGDCGSGKYCNRTSMSCVVLLAAGTTIPNDGLHDGTCGAAAAVCATGQCNAATVTCGSAIGGTCSMASQCAGNLCGSNGKCGIANGDGPCTTANAATVCQSGTCGSVGGVCIPAASGSCSADAECASGQYCDPNALACVAKLSAGMPLPNDRLHGGTCTPGLAAAVCADGQCNAASNTCARPAGASCGVAADCVADVCNTLGTCGYAPGTGSCTTANAATVCASHVCSASAGVCLSGATGGCFVDADCTAGQYCDRTAAACKAQLGPGATIPSDGLHDGTCSAANATAVCSTGACNPTTNTCANTVSGGCATDAECNNDICDPNGKCGHADGAGPCAPTTAVAVCQSGVCGAMSHVCIPADTGGCGTDADCATGMYCHGSTRHCAATLGDGTALPGDGVHGTCAANGQSAACASGLCNATTSTCAGANGAACTAANQCSGNVCGRDGHCGLADGQPGCTTATAALCQSGVCTTSGVCGSAGCAADADCPSTSYCDGGAGLCKAKLQSGQALPNDGLHNGACTPALAAAVCATGACNTATSACALPTGGTCTAGTQCSTGTCGGNGKCGIADGDAGCTTATAALCQSGTCSATGNRCVPTGTGRCAVDGDCAAAQFCAGGTLTCVAKLAVGASLPDDGIHDGVCLPGTAAAVCASGLCNARANTCASSTGSACTEAAGCANDACAANGKCGVADGEGPCTSAAQASTCQSGVCNAAAGLCQPAGSGRCVRDADCGDGRYCDQTAFTCATKLGPGAGMPNDGIHDGTCSATVAAAVCASGMCNPATNTCAGANTGTTCTGAAECSSNLCGGDGVCGAVDGTSCITPAVCRSGACTNGVCGTTPVKGNASISGGGGCGCNLPGGGNGGGVSLAGALALAALGLAATLRRQRTRARAERSRR